ncbi:MAG TPA: hypothetical protein VFT68_03110 [Lapillicoccus sp.]|nr:hypothetical protein [Lapillicoccus sp.]
MSSRPGRVVIVAAAAAALVGAALPATAEAARDSSLSGVVTADGSPVRDATVRLWLAGHRAGEASVIQTVSTDRRGGFSVDVPRSVRADDVLYATATGGRSGLHELGPDVELAASFGDLRSGRVAVNELTTVAAGYSLAQFAENGKVGGTAPGVTNAARMPRNLVDPTDGQLTRFFLTEPNGPSTEALPTFNSLASIAAGCVTRASDCAAFLSAATDAWGHRPATTWQAMTLLPKNPSGHPVEIMHQVPSTPRFTPVRTTAPAGWYLVLKFWGDGKAFGGPGNLAFDSQGRVWANANATVSRNPRQVCPGKNIYRLDPYAKGRPFETFRGGGLDGSGFGIALDPRQQVWVTNFGFTGFFCPEQPTSNSMSAFSPNGRALSPKDGYLDGPLSFPQGVKSDEDGNIWVANCGGSNLVEYPNGDHTKARTVGSDMAYTFDVAQNSLGNIYVTANQGNRVFGFHPDGTPLPGSPFGSDDTVLKPLGAASDRLGNVWVSNSEVVDIPCAAADGQLQAPEGDRDTVRLHGSMARVAPDGQVTRFQGAGMTVPWGIAVDGDDNIWVANFFGQRLSHLCGARVETCPSGHVGGEISPTQTGYFFDGLQRNTGVQIDASGNVWLTNNWKTVPTLADPYGDGLAVFLGAAAPIVMPLVGPPR